MNWTKEALAAYRSRMGLPALSDAQSEQVLAILNDVQEALRAIELPSSAEPALVFVARQGAGS